jgi:ferrous iron transport protein A
MFMLQLSFKKPPARTPAGGARALWDLRCGDRAVLEKLELPEGEARRLMELGFLPGSDVTAVRCAPGGDPRIFRVDGAEFALRCETARRLKIG